MKITLDVFPEVAILAVNGNEMFLNPPDKMLFDPAPLEELPPETNLADIFGYLSSRLNIP